MITSEKFAQVLAAVVALQVGVTNPVKDSAVGASSKRPAIAYLSLPALLDHVADARRAAGLAIAQEVGDVDGAVAVTTYLIHLSGEWAAFGPAVFPVAAPTDPQIRGGVISYARRYALLAALGLAAEDDDGSAASGRAGRGEGATQAPKDGGEPGVAPSPPSGSGVATVAPPNADAQRTMDEFHPGKPHRMTTSPTLAGWRICAQCPYTVAPAGVTV